LPSGEQVQDLSFGYDHVGNPTRIESHLPAPAPGDHRLPGGGSWSFRYDGVDRLVSAKGSMELAPGKVDRFDQGFAYTKIHNLKRKTRKHTIDNPGDSGGQVTPPHTNFDYRYTYDSQRPHHAVRVGNGGVDALTARAGSEILGPERRWDMGQAAGESTALRSQGRAFVFVACAMVACSSPGLEPDRDPVTPSCVLRGEHCERDAACCSGICQNGSCSCLSLSSRCAHENECCSSGSTPATCQAGFCTIGERAEGSTCTSDAECLSGACEGNLCGQRRCNFAGEVCRDTAQCCTGLACEGGEVCTPSCVAEGQACSTEQLCCSGLECRGGVCAGVCHRYDGACGQGGLLCCPGYECAGTACLRCGPEGGLCEDDDDCCAGGLCVSGECACPSACAEDADCCQRQVCHQGACRCSTLGEHCRDNLDCCERQGLNCNDGVCRGTNSRGSGATCIDPSDCFFSGCEQGRCCSGEEEYCEIDDECCEGLGCTWDSRCRACQHLRGDCFDDCCPGLVCAIGYGCLVPAGGECVADEDCFNQYRCSEDGLCCGDEAGRCNSDDECCDGLACDPEWKQCYPPPGTPCVGGECGGRLRCIGDVCCMPANFVCATDTDCCNGRCADGRCECSWPGEGCEEAWHCCGTSRCEGGQCCLHLEATCSSTADCCAGLTCRGNRCQSG
jgi:hypothetical protein